MTCTTRGNDGDCPDCGLVTVTARVDALCYGAGTVIDITAEDRQNFFVKLDSPTRVGSKMWFSRNELKLLSDGAHVPTRAIDSEDPDPERTPAEIENLKAQWIYDGTWDIEDTEGFGFHYQELFRWRMAHEQEQTRKEVQRVSERAGHLGFTYDQMRYFEGLELKIKVLERENDRLRHAETT